MIPRFDYQDFLAQDRMDHKKIEYMTQSLTGKVIIDKLAVDFKILDQFKIIGSKLSPISYVDHVELIFLVKYMTNHEVPLGDQWKTIENFERMKYNLHQ